MRKIIGVIILILVVVFTALLSGKIGYFLDIPSILFVVLIVLITLIGKYPLKELAVGFKAPHCKTARSASIAAGLLGTLMGGISLLNSSMENLKPAFAVSLITLFYSLILYLIFHILDRE